MDLHVFSTQQILERISRHCPHAMSVYIHCLNRSQDDGKIFFTKDMVQNDMSESWTAFKNNIKKLARENLLEWHLVNNGISVTLADIYNDD